MNIEFMQQAIRAARGSGIDTPIGAIIVRGGKVLSFACNSRETENDIAGHAEIIALKKANVELNSWRLNGCDIYVTLEPCPMCAWAILNSRIENVYFGAYDTKYGALGSTLNLVNISNHRPKVYGGIMEDECKALLSSFFEGLRK